MKHFFISQNLNFHSAPFQNQHTIVVIVRQLTQAGFFVELAFAADYFG